MPSLKRRSVRAAMRRDIGRSPSRWVAEHTVYDPPRMFEDVQIEGPFGSTGVSRTASRDKIFVCTPEAPASIRRARWGRRPSAASGRSTSKVAPSSPTTSTRARSLVASTT